MTISNSCSRQTSRWQGLSTVRRGRMFLVILLGAICVGCDALSSPRAPPIEACSVHPSSVILHLPAAEQDLYWFRNNVYSFLERGLQPQICRRQGRRLEGQRRHLRTTLHESEKNIYSLPQSSNELLRRRRVTVYIIPRELTLVTEVMKLPRGSFFLRWGDDLHFQRSVHLLKSPSYVYRVSLKRSLDGRFHEVRPEHSLEPDAELRQLEGAPQA